MTFREVDYCLRRIYKRKNQDYSAQAALHGMKMQPIVKKEEIADPKKAEMASRAMKEAIELRKAHRS